MRYATSDEWTEYLNKGREPVGWSEPPVDYDPEVMEALERLAYPEKFLPNRRVLYPGQQCVLETVVAQQYPHNLSQIKWTKSRMTYEMEKQGISRKMGTWEWQESEDVLKRQTIIKLIVRG